MTTMTLAKALNAGLRRALESDPKVLLAGEDIGKLGGVFRITEHLQRDFGPDRVLDTPLAESGILGAVIVASYALGIYPTMKEAAEAMVPAPETIYPAEDADYQAAFERWMATVAEAERTNS